MNNRIQHVLVTLLLQVLAFQFSLGGEPAGKPAFIRISRNEAKEPVSLDTAIVRYAGAVATGRPVTVDLIGAVHVGEKSYYDELNRSFRGYDAVLYELVAPANANVPTRGQKSGHPVSMMQVSMKNLLGLEFQLDNIDYKRDNFVHADLSPEEFSKSMEQRGESLTKLMFRLMGQGIAQQSTDPARSNDLALFGAFFSPNRSQDLKRVMAKQFEDLEKANAVLDGPEGSTILTERNRRAVRVLEQQLQAGQKQLAIFYGAAHLPDLEKRLQGELGLKRAEERWIEAWNLRTVPPKGTRPKESLPKESLPKGSRPPNAKPRAERPEPA